jgi:hypothetical protein
VSATSYGIKQAVMVDMMHKNTIAEQIYTSLDLAVMAKDKGSRYIFN